MLTVAVLGVLHVSPYRPHPLNDPMTSVQWAREASIGILAMVFVTAGFLVALREAWRGHIPLGRVIRLGILFQAIAIFLPVLLSRDVYSYAMYGRMLSVYHTNPYLATPIDFPKDALLSSVGPLWRDSRTVYGPVFSLLSGLIAAVVRTPHDLALAFKAVSGAAAIGTMILAADLAKRLWPERAPFAAAVIGWNPVVLFQVIGGGHNDSLISLAVLIALRLLVPDASGETTLRRELLATGVLTVATLIKAIAVLPLGLLVVVAVARRPSHERTQRLLAHFGLVLGISMAFALPFMQSKNPTLGIVDLTSHAEWPALPLFIRSVLSQVANVVVGHEAGFLLRVLTQVGFLAVFTLAFVWVASQLARRAPNLSVEAQGAAWGWAFLLFMLTIPQLLPWYVMWMLPLVWLMPKIPRLTIVAMSVVLGISTGLGMPAPPPGFLHGLMILGHYTLPPALLVLLVLLVVHLRRVVTQGRPLEAEVV